MKSAVKRNSRCVILLAGSTSWYLWNFRRNVIAALTERGMEVVVVAPADEYSERLAGLPSVRWLDWPLAADGARPFQELSSLLRYSRIVRSCRPDFVINHGIKPNIYGGLACRMLSIPYANSATGLGTMLTNSGPGPWVLRKLYAFACNRARTLFVQNLDDLAELRAMGLSPSVPVVRTFGSGVDLTHFAFAPMPEGGGRTFLFVGRLQRDKGIADFVEAAGAVGAEFPDARFVAVGSRAFANRGEVPNDVLEGWKCEGLVEFAGHQDDVRPWLRNAHVLVLPSRREGMPRAVLEAAAIGRPAICYDVPGCRDAMVPGRTGHLCADRDVPALIEAMRRMCLATDEELAGMGLAARADAEARFSDVSLVEATISSIPTLSETGAA